MKKNPLTLKAWMLVEMLGDEDHSIGDEIFFNETDAQKARVSWELEWDVFKEIVPVTVIYQLPLENKV